ncbi:ABC transporter permease [Microbispora sp. NPDC046933]|uniref:ABC transporter permease n=1 Tax=Microbispora sp. NPDC046933 TaxID=3155618 RepID=UPI003403D22B
MTIEESTVPASTRTAEPKRKRGGSPLLHTAERYALLGLTVVIALFFSVWPGSSSTFPTMANLNVVTGSQAVVALIALAALFPLVSGYFDFSLGAIAATSSVLCAGLMSHNRLPLGVAAVAAIALGAACGAVNGLLVTRARLNAFVTTLGSATLLGGAIQWYTGGATILEGISPVLTRFGSAQFLGLPRVVYVVVVVMLVLWYVLTHTPYGRALYAIGSNARSARLVGLRVDRDVFIGFVISGTIAGVAGVLQLARTGSATADSGSSLLFAALAAVFLGATAVNPGLFNVFGTMIGVLFVSASVSGLTLAGASNWAQPVFNGAALLAAVGLSTYLGHRRGAAATS